MEDLELRTILFKEGGIDANAVASSQDSKGNSSWYTRLHTDLREQLMVPEQHSSELATRAPCTTRGGQISTSRTWAKVEMESWYLELHALAQEHHYASWTTY